MMPRYPTRVLTSLVAALALQSPASAQSPMPICDAPPGSSDVSWVERFPIRVQDAAAAALADSLLRWLGPHARRRDTLEEAVAWLARTKAPLNSDVAVELARAVKQRADDDIVRAALAAFAGLGLDPDPFTALLGDNELSPQRRLLVFQVLDTTTVDPGRVEATRRSLCQLSSWTIGAAARIDRRRAGVALNRALTEDGANLYLDLLRYAYMHERVFLGQLGCSSLPQCIGAARWVWDELARP